RYAGELPLAGHREPVSLQWAADGSFALSLTRLPQNACAATGQVSPLANAPARLLAFTLSFSGTACPAIEIPNASPGQPATVVPLSTLSFSGAIDAASADAFVLF